MLPFKSSLCGQGQLFEPFLVSLLKETQDMSKSEPRSRMNVMTHPEWWHSFDNEVRFSTALSKETPKDVRIAFLCCSALEGPEGSILLKNQRGPRYLQELFEISSWRERLLKDSNRTAQKAVREKHAIFLPRHWSKSLRWNRMSKNYLEKKNWSAILQMKPGNIVSLLSKFDNVGSVLFGNDHRILKRARTQIVNIITYKRLRGYLNLELHICICKYIHIDIYI